MWLAFDIGCIECGEPSAVVGVFNSQGAAQAAADIAAAKQAKEWTGQHYFDVFELPEVTNG